MMRIEKSRAGSRIELEAQGILRLERRRAKGMEKEQSEK